MSRPSRAHRRDRIGRPGSRPTIGARVAADLDELLADPAVDAVTICTPHPLHAAQAIAAAEAGRHVVVEKPMALNAAEADAMIAAAERAGVVLSVISQRRWYPAARRVKAAIDEGRIGRPALGIVEVLGWRGPEYYAMDPWRGTLAGEGGGVLVNQAVHQLDLACWFLGEAVEVDGWTANVNHPEIEVEDTAVAVVRFASGAFGSIVASNSQRPGLHARVHVHGTSGASVGVETDRGSIFVAGVTPPSLARNDLWTIPGEEDGPARWADEDEAAAGRPRPGHLVPRGPAAGCRRGDPRRAAAGGHRSRRPGDRGADGRDRRGVADGRTRPASRGTGRRRISKPAEARS